MQTLQTSDFAKKIQVQPTQKDVEKTELLSILLGSRSPLYLYDAILKWHISSQMAGMTILEAVPQRRKISERSVYPV